MIQHITKKVSHGYEQLATFIEEEDLKTEALFSLAVSLFLLIVLYT